MKKTFQKWFPPFLMFVMALWFFGNLQAPKDKTFAFTEFGQLPLTANGRITPLDSVARNALLEIREKQTLNTEPWKSWNEHPKIIPATEWLANLMMNPAVADQWPFFALIIRSHFAPQTSREGPLQQMRWETLFVEPDPAGD